jgi:hypothetical protein
MTPTHDASRNAGSMWVEPWDPSRHLRTLRHQVNNLLAPVVVAAELLEDGSEVTELLTRSVARLRDVSHRMGEFLHMGVPDLRKTALEEILALCAPTPLTGSAGRFLMVDPARLLTNVFGEMAALSCEQQDTCAASPADPGTIVCAIVPAPTILGAHDALRITITLFKRITVEEVSDIAVPFAVSGVDVRLALVCREITLQQGVVGYDASRGALEIYLPLV